MYSTKEASEKLKSEGFEHSAKDVAVLARLGVLQHAVKDERGAWQIPAESVESFIEKRIGQNDDNLVDRQNKQQSRNRWLTTGTIVTILTLLLAFVSGTKDGLDLIIDYGAIFRNQTSACGSVLGINVAPYEQPGDDLTQIEYLIGIEAEAVLSLDPKVAVTLFREGSVIREISGPEWKGCAVIKDRYEELSDSITFQELTHDIEDITITGNRATATVVTEATYLFRSSGGYDKAFLANIGGSQNYRAIERWTFVKDSNGWHINSLIYETAPVLDPDELQESH
jgi:hypothetical protein